MNKDSQKDLPAFAILGAMTICLILMGIMLEINLVNDHKFSILAVCCSELNGNIQSSALDGVWGEDVFCYLPNGEKISKFSNCSLGKL